MPKNADSLNRSLFELLQSKGYDPTMLSTSGKEIPTPEEAEVFQFNFIKDGEDYGKVTMSIDGSHKLVIYFNDEVANSEKEDSESGDLSWYQLLNQLKRFAQKYQLSFELRNVSNLKHDMAKREYMKKKESIAEGYYPMGKKASYSDAVPSVKIVLQHTRQIEEGEQRYRNVAKIFLENEHGERFLAPTVKPGIARVYARHLAEGGLANDDRWNHIKSLCEEYQKMAGFVRATRSGQFNESTQKLIAEGINHYQSLRESLGKLAGHRGYNAYFESWTPTLMEDDSDTSTLNELFVQETVDPRIESVMPILARLSKNISEMNEVNELAEWADKLVEGDEDIEDNEVEDAADNAEQELTETPGAETLKHNQNTEKSNLKAFELDEGMTKDAMMNDAEKMSLEQFVEKYGDEDWIKEFYHTAVGTEDVEEGFIDTVKKVGGKVLDKLGHGSDEELLRDLQKKAGIPSHAQHAKPRMAVPSDEVNEEEVEESGLQAYLGNKKYGKEGMDALRKAGREHASKEEMAKIRAKYDKLDEIDLSQYDAVKAPLKGKDTSDWDKNFREKVKQYTKELDQRQKEKKEKDEKQGVAEAATPASISKVLRLIERHHPEWFDEYGVGEVEDTVVDLADMGQFSGTSAAVALKLVGHELKSLYGQQDVVKGSLEEDKGMTGYNAFKREWRAKHGADAKVPAYDSKEYTSYVYRQNDKKRGVAEGVDAESIREKITALQRDLKAVTGSYPGDGRNRNLIRRQILDLKEKLKAARGNKQDVEEAGNQSPHAKLAQLKAKYDFALKSPNPNLTTLRKIRDQIIKLEFDLGLKEGVAEGAEEDMSKEAKAMATGKCPHCHGPVKKTEHPTLTQYHCAKCGIRASVDKQGVAEGDDRGDYHSTARAANQASRTAKSRQDHAKAADLHNRAATYGLSAGQDQSVIYDHQMAAREHNRASKGLKEQGVAEDLDANQKRVGQLGPYEKVGPKGAVGKLVGSESVESTEESITEMDKSQPSSDRGGESSGDPYAKGGKATPISAKKAKKDFLGVLQKSVDKHNKAKQDTDKKVAQHQVKEGQEDLDAILRIIRK